MHLLDEFVVRQGLQVQIILLLITHRMATFVGINTGHRTAF